MKLEEKEKMTLRELIEYLENGAGWWQPFYPRKIAYGLKKLYNTEQELEKEIEYKFYRGSYGSGPDFHYYYEWRIEGIPQKENGEMKKTKMESLFGDSSSINFNFKENSLIIGMTY